MSSINTFQELPTAVSNALNAIQIECIRLIESGRVTADADKETRWNGMMHTIHQLTYAEYVQLVRCIQNENTIHTASEHVRLLIQQCLHNVDDAREIPMLLRLYSPLGVVCQTVYTPTYENQVAPTAIIPSTETGVFATIHWEETIIELEHEHGICQVRYKDTLCPLNHETVLWIGRSLRRDKIGVMHLKKTIAITPDIEIDSELTSAIGLSIVRIGSNIYILDRACTNPPVVEILKQAQQCPATIAQPRVSLETETRVL